MRNQQKINNKIVGLKAIISITTLNVNNLNTVIKKREHHIGLKKRDLRLPW